MASPILMPKAGQSMTEGKIISWLKKEGDKVSRGDPLLEIETDKASLEVEALDAGVLRKVFHAAGETVPVLSVIGVIGGERETIDFEAVRAAGGEPAPSEAPAAPPASPPPAPAISPSAPAPRVAPRAAAVEAAPPTASPGGRVFASPLARRVARERGVDVARLRGTGPGGRILRRDVESAPPAPAAARTNGAGAIAMPSIPYPPPSPRPAASVPFQGMRKAIASALEQSKRTIPHFYATAAIDVTAALEQKRALAESGVKVSLNDMVVHACARALVDEPRMSCRVFPDRIEHPADVNIGVAVGTDEGLVVPVVMKAQGRDLAGIAAECRRVIEAAQGGKLIGSGQGTFTISNLGMFGVESFSAIINPPEGAILAVGAAAPQLVPHAGGLFPRLVMRVTLSCDHRARRHLLEAGATPVP